MCQARRPLSPAEQQLRAAEDVERIAAALYAQLNPRERQWRFLSDSEQEHWCSAVRALLRRDVIRPGRRPHVERPMRGQRTIDEALDEIELRAQGRV